MEGDSLMVMLEMAMTAVVGYLGSLAGKATEGAAGEMGKRVYDSIVAKLTKDKDLKAQDTLKQLSAQPSDEASQKALIEVLQQKMQDPNFVADLEKSMQPQPIVNSTFQQTINGPVEKVVNFNEVHGSVSF